MNGMFLPFSGPSSKNVYNIKNKKKHFIIEKCNLSFDTEAQSLTHPPPYLKVRMYFSLCVRIE